jgi:hypothetical protein
MTQAAQALMALVARAIHISTLYPKSVMPNTSRH